MAIRRLGFVLVSIPPFMFPEPPCPGVIPPDVGAHSCAPADEKSEG
ncbi:hypothetical protein GFS60_06752 (plasmid) [Rhodococcus sp. WAY2]|nr:hypothetical protein GFS60_06752 [Rhodococcus sp. WAY2]